LIEPEPSSLESLMGGTRDYSDTACVVIGRLGGEGQDLPHIQKKWKATEDDSRSYLQLSSEESGLLSLVKEAGFARVIVLIDACNTMELGFLNADWIDAAISAGPCGQSGSLAIVDALLGEINPSGKTVDTYAYDLQSAASYANSPNCRKSIIPKVGNSLIRTVEIISITPKVFMLATSGTKQRTWRAIGTRYRMRMAKATMAWFSIPLAMGSAIPLLTGL
jgi:hypothetical protein